MTNDEIVDGLIGNAYRVVKYVAGEMPVISGVWANIAPLQDITTNLVNLNTIHSNLVDLLNVSEQAATAAADRALAQAAAIAAQTAIPPVQVVDYTALRAYAGPATVLGVTGYSVSSAPTGIAGQFTRDDSDTTTPDNGGTVLVDVLGRRWKRVFSGAADVRWFGAKGDGTTDDTTALHLARDSGAKGLLFSPGIYRNTGLVFGPSHLTKSLHFEPGAQLLLVSAANRIALDIQRHTFTVTGMLDIAATGTPSDGFATKAVRHGTTSQGYSYLTINHLIVSANFSSRCFVSYACVNVKIGRADVNAGSPLAGSTCYGVSFEPGVAGCTMVMIEQAYITGGIRGFNGQQLSWAQVGTLALEYGGSQSTTNGALHLAQCGNVVITNLYGEQNERNKVLDDAAALFINDSMFASLGGADAESFTGVAYDARGIARLTNRSLQIGEILPEPHVDVSVTTGLHLGGSGSSQVVNLNGARLFKTRRTGWTVPTGTASRATFATHAGQSISASPTQAEVQAIDDHVKVLSERLKALIDDFHATAGHGLIGA